ncbi:MAG: type I methionyl aminopeptidase [Ignavibacteria bacterium]|nr:type I methionyl aminopeptidase [Ignavibacteria bacterium]
MGKIILKTQREIELMRESGRIVSAALRLLEGFIKPGVTTKELDVIADDFISSEGGIPIFKGYTKGGKGRFPASICTSVDDVVVHGIPSSHRRLQEGEIVSLDVGVIKNGYVADGAWTFAVGSISPEKERLMRITQEALFVGIEKAIAYKQLHDISSAVQQYVENNGYSVVRDLVGHGVGRTLHEDPPVPNFGKQGEGPKMHVGMTIAIEPMVNSGSPKVYTDGDGWSVRTEDGLPSAHFEHTVAITNGQPDILTL